MNVKIVKMFYAPMKEIVVFIAVMVAFRVHPYKNSKIIVAKFM
jgi:hypothetical protein